MPRPPADWAGQAGCDQVAVPWATGQAPSAGSRRAHHDQQCLPSAWRQPGVSLAPPASQPRHRHCASRRGQPAVSR